MGDSAELDSADEAIASYRQAMQLDSRNAQVNFRLAWSLRGTENLDEAAQDLPEGVRVDEVIAARCSLQ